MPFGTDASNGLRAQNGTPSARSSGADAAAVPVGSAEGDKADSSGGNSATFDLESAIEAMNEDFTDIITEPKIKVIEATLEERADNDVVDLPRIAFGFNRRDYGRLRQLIDVLNSL